MDRRVCSVDELKPGQARLVEDGRRQVAVFNVGGTLHAIDNLCPHRQGPLHEGWLEGFLVSCPWHGWQFDLRTGACATLANRDVAIYPVRIDGDAIVVTLTDDPTQGL
jgi:NAD(P)H-dependent nitrite reductase small subunit